MGGLELGPVGCVEPGGVRGSSGLLDFEPRGGDALVGGGEVLRPGLALGLPGVADVDVLDFDLDDLLDLVALVDSQTTLDDCRVFLLDERRVVGVGQGVDSALGRFAATRSRRRARARLRRAVPSPRRARSSLPAGRPARR